MSNIKCKLAVFGVSIASCAAGSALLTEGPAVANAIPQGAPAQVESQRVSHVQYEGLRVQRDNIRVQPDLRRRVRPDVRR
jgi:hypothetical protein